MGFFGDLWSSIKNTAGKVWSGIKDTASKVYHGVGSAINWVKDKAQPIITAVGNIAGKIPVIGAPISAAANAANNLINQASNIHSTVGNIGNQIGTVGDKIFQRWKLCFRR